MAIVVGSAPFALTRAAIQSSARFRVKTPVAQPWSLSVVVAQFGRGPTGEWPQCDRIVYV